MNKINFINGVVLVIVLCFSVLLNAQENTLVRESVDTTYSINFNVLKEAKKADGAIINVFFPEAKLKEYSYNYVNSFVEQYNNPNLRSKLPETFTKYVLVNFANQVKKEKENIKKNDINSFIKADSLITPVFLTITELSLYEYIKSLVKKKIEDDVYISNTNKQIQDINLQHSKALKVVRDSIKLVVSKFAEQKELIKKAHEKTISDTLEEQKAQFKSAISVQDRVNEIVTEVLNTKTNYNIQNITAKQRRRLANRFYLGKDLFLKKDQYAFSQDKQELISTKLDSISNVKQASEVAVEVNQVFKGNLKTLSIQSKEFLDSDFSVFWAFTKEQQKELNQIKSSINKFNGIKNSFNRLLVTLDGKDAQGRKLYLNHHAPDGRKKDEKRKHQQQLIQDFKTQHPNYTIFPVFKSFVEKIERIDANASFAKYTI